MLETGIRMASLQYCTMDAFGEDALQRKAMSHKSSFIIIDYTDFINVEIVLIIIYHKRGWDHVIFVFGWPLYYVIRGTGL